MKIWLLKAFYPSPSTDADSRVFVIYVLVCLFVYSFDFYALKTYELSNWIAMS